MRGALAAGPLCVALLGAGGAHGQGIAPEVEAVGDPLEAEYQAAVQRAQGGDLAGAAVAFDALLGRLPAPHALFTLTLYGAARSYQQLDTPAAACEAVERFTRFIGREDAEVEKRERASKVLGGLIARCSAPAPSRAGAWVATGGAVAGLAAGAVLLAQAADAVDTGDAAYRRFLTGGRGDAALTRDIAAADDRARERRTAGYAALGVGAVLGGLATWLWLDDDAPQRAASPPLAAGGHGGGGIVGGR